jgi:hypothetical protein
MSHIFTFVGHQVHVVSFGPPNFMRHRIYIHFRWSTNAPKEALALTIHHYSKVWVDLLDFEFK